MLFPAVAAALLAGAAEEQVGFLPLTSWRFLCLWRRHVLDRCLLHDLTVSKRQLRTPLVAPYEKPRFKPADFFGRLSASKGNSPPSHQNCRRTCPEHKALVCNLMVPDVIETLTSHLRLSWDRSRRQPSKLIHRSHCIQDPDIKMQIAPGPPAHGQL